MHNDRILVALYCDDIREEVGNKLSFMGCYADDIVLEKFPTTIPKLCAYVTAHTPIDAPFEKFVLRASLNGEILAQTEFPADGLKRGIKELLRQQPYLPNATDERRFMRIATVFTFQPLVVSGLGRIRVQAETESGLLKAGSLEIKSITSK